MSDHHKLPFEQSDTPDKVGESNPVVEADTRPKMTEIDANYHSHVAGVKARVAAAEKPDVDVIALMRALLSPKEIGGKMVESLDSTALLLSQEVSTRIEREEWEWLGGHGYQLGVMPWICLFPDEAFELFDAEDFTNAKKAIRAVCKQTSAEELLGFNTWVNRRLELMRKDQEEETGELVKKKPKGPRSTQPKSRKK